MNFVPVDLIPQSSEEKFLGTPHKDRWECLKQVIVKLYTGLYGPGGKSMTLDQVAEFMRTHYSFHAAPTEYRPRLRAWNATKRVVKYTKDDITAALGRRKRPVTSTSLVTIQEGGVTKSLDAKKLKRHLKDRDRHRPVEVLTPGLLSSWNLPYASFVSSLSKRPDEPSPFGTLGTTPKYLSIQSPEATTPGREPNSLSPNMELVYEKLKNDRASLFLQGRLKELVISMCQEDRKSLFNYFYDFYIHAFHMARRGVLRPVMSPIQGPILTPQRWDIPSPFTPSFFINSSPSSPISSRETDISWAPSQLCKWAIHVADPDYVLLDDDAPPVRQESFEESLHQSIVSNSFEKTIATDKLPLARDIIVKSLEDNPRALEVDAWKLAIMAGNFELLWDLFERNYKSLPDEIYSIHPYHLAASFLDGGHTCCLVLRALVRFDEFYISSHHNIDNHGHTILDTLMVSILRSHTSISPDDVSHAFHSPKRFPGEEMDICGRWDPESPKVHELFGQGYSRIPTKWKHPFCHTAVQAICHSCIVVFMSNHANIGALSGLFLRRCTGCGLELRLGPLHTVVVTAFYLAQLGMVGETLFGAISLMVCLLTLGADATLKVNISVEEILNTSEQGMCLHTPSSALELMRLVPDDIIEKWNDDCKTGWTCLLHLLGRAEQHNARVQDDEPERNSRNESVDWSILPESPSNMPPKSQVNCNFSKPDIHEWLKLPCSEPWLGLLWATIQTELLTYRRLEEGDSWISSNFSMNALSAWLREDSSCFMTPLVQNHMLEDHTPCGWFSYAQDWTCPTAQEVCVSHFMNMENYERSSFLDIPGFFGMRPL